MKTFKYQGEKLRFDITQYVTNNALAVTAQYFDTAFKAWMPYGAVTINLLGTPPADDCAYLNVSDWPDVGDMLVQHGLAEPTGKQKTQGYGTYPLYKFNLDNFY